MCHAPVAQLVAQLVEHPAHNRMVRGLNPFRRTNLYYEYCWGPIPLDMIIRHKCDNPSCINPNHLLIGTHKDNSNDKIERGRYNAKGLKGIKNPRCKLKEKDIFAIR